MKLLDLVEDKIIISPACLVISPFSEMWEADKSKSKSAAIAQIKFVWFYADFSSPYFQQPENERLKMIAMDVLKDKDFKMTKELKDCIAKYKELHYTSAIRMVDSARILSEKMDKYFRDVNITDADIKKVTDTFIAMPKIVASIKEAEKKCMEELSDGVKVRGNAKVGLWEDK